MPRYVLDTETCFHIMKRSESLVLKRLQRVPVTERMDRPHPLGPRVTNGPAFIE
jgi:hypothetical protein